MNVAGDAEAVLETAFPALRGAKLAAIGVAAAIVIALVAFGGWWFFIRPHAAQVQAATAKVEAATAAATTGAAQDTVHIVVDHNQADAAIVARIQENTHAILSAKGATDQVAPDVAAAGRAALCMSAAYRGDDQCAAVPGTGEVVGAAQPDAGGGTTQR